MRITWFLGGVLEVLAGIAGLAREMDGLGGEELLGSEVRVQMAYRLRDLMTRADRLGLALEELERESIDSGLPVVVRLFE